MDEGLADGHLTAGPLHGNANRLFRALQEGLVKTQEGEELRVQGRDMLELCGDAKSFHIISPLILSGVPYLTTGLFYHIYPVGTSPNAQAPIEKRNPPRRDCYQFVTCFLNYTIV